MQARALFAAIALVALGYALGRLDRAPARADESSKVADALRDIARAEASQSESLRQLVRAAERLAR